MRYPILLLIMFVLMMENRVGEFTPLTRAIFNIGFYIFAMLANFIEGKTGEVWQKIIYWGWSALFCIWGISEVVDVFIPIPHIDSRILIVSPLILGYAYRYKNII